MLKQQLIKQILVIMHELEIDGEPLIIDPTLIKVNYPDDRNHGDYATNLALIIAKKLNKNPLEVADFIAQKLRKLDSDFVEKIEVAKPGFINFFIKTKYFIEYLANSKTKREQSYKGKKIIIEFTDPNPFKEFHIGHLYSNIVGESISRLLESQGAEVIRVCYQGDVGMHVAKSIWGMEKKLGNLNLTIEELEVKIGNNENPIPPELSAGAKKAQFLGESYALGATAYETDPDAKQEMVELNRKIFLREDPEINNIYDIGKKWSLEYFDKIYRGLGTKFKAFYFESKTAKKGVELTNKLLNEGVLEKSQGAIIFPGEKYGLHSRVFINSQGFPTYEAKELGLAVIKSEEFKFNESIIITGNEVNEYFKVLLKVLSLVDEQVAKKTKHISHAMVRLPEGKMSSRKGTVITGLYLINEVTRALGENRMNLNLKEYKKDSNWNNAQEIAKAAVKYTLLKTSLGKDIEFNLEETVNFEGNSGPYLQYTYVRTKSLLNKAEFSNSNFNFSDLDLSSEEREILRLLSQFLEVVENAALRYSPNILCTYLFELAQNFNGFYQKHQILKADEKVRDFRLLLTKQTGETLKEGLQLLGIQSPEQM